MPNYEFMNKNTNEIEIHSMSYTQLDEFKSNNLHLERYFGTDSFPVLGDGMRMDTPGAGKADSTFEKYIINRIKEKVPHNTVKAGHKRKMQREW
jgi:hypothetical protein